MMTEYDARQKWCPMSKEKDELRDCIGEKCACWVWDSTPKLEAYTFLPDLTPEDAEEPLLPSSEEFSRPQGVGWRLDGDPEDDEEGFCQHWVRDYDPNRLGHCGLAR